jgi:hypothetical protein
MIHPHPEKWITIPEDIRAYQWQRLEKARNDYISASEDVSSWLHLQLKEIESFRNGLTKKGQ